MRRVPQLRVELGSSRQAELLVCLGCISTAMLVAWLPLSPWLQLPAVVLIGGYAIWLLRWWAQRSHSRAIAIVELGLDHRVTLTRRTGQRIEGCVRPDSYVGPRVTTIVMRADGARRSTAIAILPDMLPREDFRKLRVMLRFKQPAQDGGTEPSVTIPSRRNSVESKTD
jgi:hypothetical protein